MCHRGVVGGCKVCSVRRWEDAEEIVAPGGCAEKEQQPGGHASDANPGAAILAASQRKREHTYPEFSGSRRCHLLILGLEVGGRWGEEAADFLRALAHARARTAPALLRSAAVQAYVHRWAGLLSVAAQRALAETLLELPAAAAPGVDGEPPPFAATLADVRWHERPPDSRLPR